MNPVVQMGSERRILLVSASLAGGIPVNLRDAVTGIGACNTDRLTTAIRDATGKRPENTDSSSKRCRPSPRLLVSPHGE